jgi:HSP20 family protein
MCKVNSSLYVHKLPATRRENGGQSHWIPNTDVYVTDEGLVVKVELSGMRREDLELAIDGNQLLITGQRPDGCRIPGVKFLVMEIEYGTFECVIDVPGSYDLSLARATYQNGFLRVDVPLSATSSKSVLVQTSEGK